MREVLKFCFCLTAILFSPFLKGQTGDYFLETGQYPFIRYEENKFICPADSSAFEELYSRLDKMVLWGTGKMNIVHIGGSHIQGDYYTQEIRKHLQNLSADMNGGRGFIFPFSMARTNNPSNYRVTWSGNWEYCKNTQFEKVCPLGLSGMAVFTSDREASVLIDPNMENDLHYQFNKVRIYHAQSSYELSIMTDNQLYNGSYDSIHGYSVFHLPETSILDLRFTRKDSINDKTILYGISLDNDDPGIVYHAIGVNGARLNSFLSCEYFNQHLVSLEPDLIVFSIGTNDGNTREFNSGGFYNEYKKLIENTRLVLPEVPLLITVPNDCYIRRRYLNRNTAFIQSLIMRLAKEKNCGVWDFYHIMGGQGSSKSWYNAGLMQYDKIHFNREGYLLKGDLFVTAFLRGWEKNLSQRIDNDHLTERRTSIENNPHSILK